MLTKNKKISKKSKIEKVFSENQVMTLLENMNDGIILLSENQNGLREEFSEFKQETKQNFKKVNSDLNEFKQETKQSFKKVNSELTEFKQETKQNFKKVSSELTEFKQGTKQNFKKVFTSLDEIKIEVKSIKKELNRIEKEGIKRIEFQKLVERVAELEMFLEKQKREKAQC